MLLYLYLNRSGSLKEFIEQNINGILGTTIVHLVLIMSFLFIKVGKIRDYQKEQVLIEFEEELQQTVEELLRQNELLENLQDNELPALDQLTIRSIAANVSSTLSDELSTEKYEQQVMDELGIESLKPEMPENPAEDFIQTQEEVLNDEPAPEIPGNIIRKDNMTVSYELLNRWHRNIYIPSFKCQEGGSVMLTIEVNQQGRVIAANVIQGLSTDDPCLLSEALNSASSAVFNSSQTALPVQRGTITYIFLPQ